VGESSRAWELPSEDVAVAVPKTGYGDRAALVVRDERVHDGRSVAYTKSEGE